MIIYKYKVSPITPSYSIFFTSFRALALRKAKKSIKETKNTPTHARNKNKLKFLRLT